MKKILAVLMILTISLAAVAAFAGCSSNDASDKIAEWKSEYTAGSFGIRDERDPFVEFELSTGDTIRVELYPDLAPISVENFIKYVEDGFYDGVVFHRIIKGFMIQAGGYAEEDGKLVQKEPTYSTIKGEFAANGVMNNLSHVRGVISMARLGEDKTTKNKNYDSASSQFFICSEISAINTRGLNGQYAAFGRVIDEESMQVVSALEKVQTTQKDLYNDGVGHAASDVPLTTISIKKATLYRID